MFDFLGVPLSMFHPDGLDMSSLSLFTTHRLGTQFLDAIVKNDPRKKASIVALGTSLGKPLIDNMAEISRQNHGRYQLLGQIWCLLDKQMKYHTIEY